MQINSFNEKIYSLLRKVPKGKVTTYKILANRLGTRAYRAVGSAMRCNPYAPAVPCHRVVSSGGKIGGFMGTTNTKSDAIKKKIMMLKKEGVKVKNNKIVNFEKTVFYFK
ncbi:MAG TPA: MGMT family protein [Candidatus Nanoarchaeia archaeon]|nr:MGMT family protein [Candidatus Nanoarchaeia archaeon]